MNDNDGNSTASHIENEVTLEDVWNDAVSEIGQIDARTENWRNLSLPLARIKKIMKSEDFVAHELERQANFGAQGGIDRQRTKFMISQEAPVLITKACELMIKELTIRAWRHTERSRRRTLQRADIHAAVGEDESFDFLIDIVPRAQVFEGNHQGASHEMPRDTTPQENEPTQDQDQSNQFGVLLQQGVDGRQMQLQQNPDPHQNSNNMPTWNDPGL